MNLDEADHDTDADLGNADLDDFSDLEPDDADLQAVLAEENLGEEDLGEADLDDAGQVADDADLVGDVDGPEGPEEPEPGQPSAEADTAAGAPLRRASA